MDPIQTQGWEPTGTLEQMRKELKVSIESTVEKSVMETQMNKSKVPKSSTVHCCPFYVGAFGLCGACTSYPARWTVVNSPKPMIDGETNNLASVVTGAVST